MPPADPPAYLDTALAAAVDAGGVLRRLWNKPRQVQAKGPRDIVTDADFVAQAAALGRVQSAYPQHAFLSEEGRHAIDLSGPTPTWIIDPLDGTTNYARRQPVFAVSVALAWDGAVQVGAIHDPLRRETFYAARGGGAWLQRGVTRPRALRVSGVPDLDSAVVGLDWAREPRLRAKSLAALNRLAPRCRTVRATGSAALGLAYVGAGLTDGYFHHMLQPWDLAAAVLLIAEAGGAVTTPSGSAWRLGLSQIAVSNGRIHAEFVAALRG
ncbi:MAG: inositol monophosphatase [Anaerolineales bacterium]|nr:inositol monophosphatase [Anaerolineales bacterium]